MIRSTLVAVALVIGSSCPRPALASADQAFLKKAIEGDNSEMRLGALAAKRGQSVSIRAFGQMLEKDHADAKLQATKVARAAGLAPPTQMSPEARVELAKLNRLKGAAFDREFARYMVEDHKKDISDFEKQALSPDAATAALAKQTLPALRTHLATAESLAPP
jgi:putative membrane protein